MNTEHFNAEAKKRAAQLFWTVIGQSANSRMVSGRNESAGFPGSSLHGLWQKDKGDTKR